MKFTIKKSVLAAELAAVSSLIKTKGSLPILSFAKVEASDGGKLSLTTTDLDARYSRTTEAVVTKPGVCLFPVAKVKEWLGIVGGDDVSVEAGTTGIKLSMPEMGSLRLSAMPVEEFPPDVFGAMKLIGVADFAPIKNISWSIADADARPELNGVFLELEGDDFLAATMDGRKLGTVKIKAEVVDRTFTTLLIPEPYVGIVSSLGSCKISDTPNNLVFDSLRLSLSVRKSERSIPNWRIDLARFPYIGSMSVIRYEFETALRQCHILRGGEIDQDKGVRVNLRAVEGGLWIGCVVEKTGESYDTTIAGRLEGKFPNITLATDQLMQFFSLPDDSLLKIDSTGDRTFLHMNAGDTSYWFAPMIPKGNTK